VPLSTLVGELFRSGVRGLPIYRLPAAIVVPPG